MYIGQKYKTEGFDPTIIIHGSLAELEIWSYILDGVQADVI